MWPMVLGGGGGTGAGTVNTGWGECRKRRGWIGGGVIKQRIARKRGGRSGGFRTIVLFRRGALSFFVYGFAKGDRENLRRDELAT